MNGAQITALDRPPTALEFSQMVALSRPVVFRTGVEVPDSSRWTTEYLAKTMGDRPISVSVTPDGCMDFNETAWCGQRLTSGLSLLAVMLTHFVRC